MSNWITVRFFETGVPKTGLSPTLTVLDLADNSVSVNAQAMTEVGDGFYKYDFTTRDTAKDYVFSADSVTLLGSERYATGNISSSTWKEILDGAYTAEESMRLFAAVLAGKLSGAGTATETFRDISDTKDRITATVDASGNRKVIILDAT